MQTYKALFLSGKSRLSKVLSLEQELCNEDVITLNSKPREFCRVLENSDTIDSKQPVNNLCAISANEGLESLINESFEVSLASSVCDKEDNDANLDMIHDEKDDFDEHNSSFSVENKVSSKTSLHNRLLIFGRCDKLL